VVVSRSQMSSRHSRKDPLQSQSVTLSKHWPLAAAMEDVEVAVEGAALAAAAVYKRFDAACMRQ
jgi:hypothetical protein